jgi:hypothetical protein
MEFCYDDRLVEEAVIREIDSKLRSGDRAPYELYHEMTDELYSLMSAADRIDAFRRVHLYFFARLGFKAAFQAAVEQFPLFKEKISKVFIQPALKHEFADLSRSPASLNLVIHVRSSTLADRGALLPFLQRELLMMHDILNPAFRYSSDIPAGMNLSQENLFRDRYGFLWRMYADARLSRAGLQPASIQAKRREDFVRMYPSMDRSAMERAFDVLWSRPFFTHPELRDMASSLPKLLAAAWMTAECKDDARLPGSPCPLCRFPTHRWAQLNGEAARVEQEIQKDFPQWRLSHGLCDRCGELYALKTGAN